MSIEQQPLAGLSKQPLELLQLQEFLFLYHMIVQDFGAATKRKSTKQKIQLQWQKFSLHFGLGHSFFFCGNKSDKCLWKHPM